MTFQPAENSEPIPGYLLSERIGIGGYGEVWKVRAPGGLTKAIKFVYGRLDDDRGARELKALGRIKEVRHPFLLSLERFDVVDGQLYIVTELAEMSLMDRFRQCRESGLPGIPRDELLAYLRDAADALDYMSDKYGLQHLDIKPENLLLVGGRVKVADFGLVKDLQDTNCTTIGGVTPLYATPEAFDGKASRQSDQYSLAIVYQEMLTGVLPFPGVTTAQLAAQHLHSPPLLAALGDQDRAIVARALAKQPEARFATCRELVDRLLEGPAAHQEPSAAESSESLDNEQQRATIALRSTPCEHLDETIDCGGPGVTDDEPISLEPLEPLTALTETGLRPTLFIGLGGAAAQVLRPLRRRLHQRFGDRQSIPSFRFLLLDTDSTALRDAEQGDEGEVLESDETVYLPLRKPADYRAASDQLLSWLSRRWLYNIPRSLHTEGLRPLGRLAFVDHAETIVERIRQTLVEAVQPEAEATSASTIGTGLRDASPRVFIISSISGGTGGGMLLDVAYAVRQLLTTLDFDPDGVCGIMLHATFNKSSANDLRKANAYATLTELNHFMQGGGAYRAGPTEILPVGELSEAPFGDAYLIDLGDDLQQADFQAAVETVAHYLYLDAATAFGAALDCCRRLSHQPHDGHDVPRLRTFGLFSIGCDKYAVASAQAEAFCHRLVQGMFAETEQPGVRLAKPDFQLEELAERLQTVIDKSLGGGGDVYFRNLLAQCALEGQLSRGAEPPKSQAAARVEGLFAEPLRRIHAVLGLPAAADPSQPASPSRVEQAIQDGAKKLGAALTASLTKSISELVDTPRARLPAALTAVSMFQEHLRALRQAADERQRREQAASVALCSKLQRGETGRSGPRWWNLFGGPSTGDAEARLLLYCQLRLQTMVYRSLAGLLQSVSSGLAGFNEQLVRLRPRLEQLARGFGGQAGPPAETPGDTRSRPAEGARSLAPLPRLADPEFVLEFERSFQRDLIDAQGGLLALAAADHDAWKLLHECLQQRARAVVLQALEDVDAARFLLERHPDQAQLVQSLSSAADKASPKLGRVGAAERLLAVLPQGRNGGALAETIKQEMPDVALTLFDADSDLVLCREGEQVSLARAATALIENRPDYAAAARRVLTRNDVTWAPLGARERAAAAAVTA
ncbi:MAG TPA: tubulin-like doman-containing protein, partial [Pirellulales bacterium]|nr:tubulin-like doman-containing protein [Pirellulales bacterium]